MNATFTGMHELDRRLPDWSRAGREAEAVEMQQMRTEFEQHALPFDPVLLRGNPVVLDCELARATLDVRLAEHDSGFFQARNPALWTGEAIFGVVSLMIRDFAPVRERLGAIRARLAAIPAFLGDLPDAITVPVPAQWIARAQRECAAADGLFDRGLAMWLDAADTDANTVGAIMIEAERAREAFAGLAQWLARCPAAGDDAYGVGERTFRTLLRRGHFCEESAEELLAQALTEMPLEQARLEELATSVSGSWPAAQAAMADEHPSVHEYYHAFAQRWQECHDLTVQHDAVTWQPWPIRYVPIPSWAQEYAPQLYWLFYRSPAPFDPYTIYDYVVTPIDDSMPADEQTRRLRAWNSSTITLNHVVHHGAVGHHVQNWHARYRCHSRIGAIAATDCASRIGMFIGGSLAEGWACYATQLMEELGLLTPLERVSEQHTRVRMLARAIVDIRLHLRHITFDAAVRYYETEVGMPTAIATAEATKNAMFPCTALMYWLGTGRILALRETLRAKRGASFSMRAFHDSVLARGAIPVPLIATLLTEPAS